MLHTVHRSPYASDDLASCLRVIAPGEHLLLYEDAVIAAGVGTEWGAPLAETIDSGIAVSALAADCAARGLSIDQMIDEVQPIDYRDFVRLVAGSNGVQAW